MVRARSRRGQLLVRDGGPRADRHGLRQCIAQRASKDACRRRSSRSGRPTLPRWILGSTPSPDLTISPAQRCRPGRWRPAGPGRRQTLSAARVGDAGPAPAAALSDRCRRADDRAARLSCLAVRSGAGGRCPAAFRYCPDGHPSRARQSLPPQIPATGDASVGPGADPQDRAAFRMRQQALR